jgi:hypothetical protein
MPALATILWRKKEASWWKWWNLSRGIDLIKLFLPVN